jgi:divalent metal cation (Fe/Co/Zn/Cd) transporter
MILLDVDPSVVKPGWTALIVVLLLAVAMVFLYLSMRKQFRKIRTPDDVADESEQVEDSASERPPGTSS